MMIIVNHKVDCEVQRGDDKCCRLKSSKSLLRLLRCFLVGVTLIFRLEVSLCVFLCLQVFLGGLLL